MGVETKSYPPPPSSLPPGAFPVFPVFSAAIVCMHVGCYQWPTCKSRSVWNRKAAPIHKCVLEPKGGEVWAGGGGRAVAVRASSWELNLSNRVWRDIYCPRVAFASPTRPRAPLLPGLSDDRLLMSLVLPFPAFSWFFPTGPFKITSPFQV